MPGEEWGRLVSVPSATDVDAALSEVKVRAAPIARRRSRIRRLASAAGLAVVLGGSFWAGTFNGATGIRVGAHLPPRTANTYSGAPVLEDAGVAGTQGPRLDSAIAWHVTTWMEEDGVVFGQSDGWVTGPPGTGFALSLDDWERQRVVQTAIYASLHGDSVLFSAQSVGRHELGRSRRDMDVIEEGRAFSGVRVRRGSTVMMYPFGKSTSADAPRFLVRIEGPDLVPPARPRVDSAMAPFLSYFQDHGEFTQLGLWVGHQIRMAQVVGARAWWAHGGSWGLAPSFAPARPHILLTHRGTSGAAEYLGMAQRMAIPGVVGMYQVIGEWVPRETSEEVCVSIRPTDTKFGLRDSHVWGGCMHQEDHWAPIEFLTPHGERIRAELLNKPPILH